MWFIQVTIDLFQIVQITRIINELNALTSNTTLLNKEQSLDKWPLIIFYLLKLLLISLQTITTRYYTKICQSTKTTQIPEYNDLERVLNINYYIKHTITTYLNHYCKIYMIYFYFFVLHTINLKIHRILISVMFYILELSEIFTTF